MTKINPKMIPQGWVYVRWKCGAGMIWEDVIPEAVFNASFVTNEKVTVLSTKRYDDRY